MDVLSDILDTLNFKGTFYYTTEFTSPWGIEVPKYQNVARFHLAVGGECWVKMENVEQPVRLSPGDMIIIPHGGGHGLSDSPTTPLENYDDALARSKYDGEGYFVYGGREDDAPTKLVCGHFEFDDKFSHPLVSELPEYILISGKQAMEFAWFDNAMRFMSYESRVTSMGSAAIIKRLSEILFIHAIRVWSATLGERSSFIRAMADRKIGRSIRAFHAMPEQPWTIEKLAREAGLSRSTYANRFRELMDMTPLGYVTLWRMQKACHYLLESELPIDAIAENVGYQSMAAFAKVFKKTIGVGPGAYRRSGRNRETRVEVAALPEKR